MSDPKRAELFIFPGKGKRDPRAMLEAALSAADEFEEVVIIARPKEGSDYPMFFSASHARNPEILWDIEQARQSLVDGLTG